MVVRRCSDILSCYPEPEMKVLRASYPFKTPPLTYQALSHWSEKLLVAWYPSTCLHISASVCRSCWCDWDFFLVFFFLFIRVVLAGLLTPTGQKLASGCLFSLKLSNLMKVPAGFIVMSHRGWLLMNSFRIQKREVIINSLCTHCERFWNSWTSFQAFCRWISQLFVECKRKQCRKTQKTAARLWSYKTSYFHAQTFGIMVLLRLCS